MRAIRRMTAAVLALMLALAGWCAAAEATAIRLQYTKASLRAGKAATLRVRVTPARSSVTWKSSDPGVASVSGTGRVVARKAGTTVITASSGSVSATCRLTVTPVKITKVALSVKSKALSLGDGAFQLTASVRPAGADASTLTWKSSNTALATVDQNGLVTPKAAGTVRVAAVSPGGRKAICTFRIEASDTARRALVIGEARRNTTFGLTALPMVPSEVTDIARMFTDRGVRAATLLNGTRAGVLSAIQKAFGGAGEDDVSYLYITCHGGFSGGAYRVYPCGDGYFSAIQLRNALDQVPGKIVLMVGSCHSGSLIAKGNAGAQAFVREFVGAKSKSGEFKSDKYQVLCACRSDESGYGVVTTVNATGQIVSERTYNFFGKAVLEGGAGAADASGDGAVTLEEMYRYVKARVSQLHEQWRDKINLSAADTQTVVVYPDNSAFVLFS